MSKVKSVSTYNGTSWDAPTPLGANIENIDITNQVTSQLDDQDCTWSSLYSNDFVVQDGDTGASAWEKFNKFRKRIATAMALYPGNGATNVPEGTKTWAQLVKEDILNAAHPIGSYYWSSESTDPATLFGGTWTPIQNRFIFAAGPGYAVGAEAGASTVELNLTNMPRHRHSLQLYSDSGNNAPYIATGYATNKGLHTKGGYEGYEGGTASLGEGRSVPHENMPPYIVAYCWRRTA